MKHDNKASDLTITRPEFLVNGADSDFRGFIYNLLIYIISPYLITKLLLEAVKRKSGVRFIMQRLGLSYLKIK